MSIPTYEEWAKALAEQGALPRTRRDAYNAARDRGLEEIAKHHRRAQQAESALVDWRRVADEKAARPSRSLGKGLMRWALAKAKEEDLELRAAYAPLVEAAKQIAEVFRGNGMSEKIVNEDDWNPDAHSESITFTIQEMRNLYAALKEIECAT